MSEKTLAKDIDSILDSLKDSIDNKGLIYTSTKTKISPGHLFNVVHYRQVYKLSDKMRARVESSGLLV